MIHRLRITRIPLGDWSAQTRVPPPRVEALYAGRLRVLMAGLGRPARSFEW